MRFTNVAIEGMAYALPPETWTSSLIEEELAPLYDRLNLPHGRLELMTGIRERRFWPASYRPSEASADAGNALLEAGVDGGEVDLLIHAAVCRDRLEPATASYVHRLMGLGSSTQILDVSNACLGFLNGIQIAGSMIESGQIDYALIVDGEGTRQIHGTTIQKLLKPDATIDDLFEKWFGAFNGCAANLAFPGCGIIFQGYLGEKRGHLVVLILRPAFEGMVVAFIAIESNS